MTNEEIENFVDKWIDLRKSHNIHIDLNIAMTGAAWWTREKVKEELIDKACKWLERELAEPMPDELYAEWCNEKLSEFREAMKE